MGVGRRREGMEEEEVDEMEKVEEEIEEVEEEVEGFSTLFLLLLLSPLQLDHH